MNHPLFSSDDHIDLRWLPRDLWISRVPRNLLDRAPKVVDGETGPVWMCEGRNWGTWGSTLSGTSGKKWAIERIADYKEGELRPTIAPLRLKDMDFDGVQTSVMFGPVTPLDITEPELRVACYRAFNDWLIEFCSESPERLRGVGFLPTENPAEAAAELRRLAGTPIKQVNLLLAQLDVPAHEAVWAPFWDAAEETGMIVSCHFSTRITKLGQARKPGAEPHAVDTLSLVKGWTQFVDPLVGLMAHGVLEHRPGVKLVLAETGVGWLPFVIDRMDQRFEQVMDNKAFWDQRGGIPLKQLPSETFRRQVYVSFAEDRAAMSLLPFFGEDNIMWASDYPHPDSTFPKSKTVIENQMRGLSPELTRKFTFGNAEKLYGGAQ